MNYHALIESAIAKGWVRPPVIEPNPKGNDTYGRDYMRIRRAQWHEQGLNSGGKPPKRPWGTKAKRILPKTIRPWVSMKGLSDAQRRARINNQQKKASRARNKKKFAGPSPLH